MKKPPLLKAFDESIRQLPTFCVQLKLHYMFIMFLSQY